jgi:glycosyltransferase involved in cell wall biosynthesis
LQLLDVYVLPSVWEGLPLAILEAMAARKPIVATSVGGVPSVLVHNEHGLLVSPKNPAQLSDAIRTLLLDSVLATRLAGNAVDRFFDRFTLAKMVAAYEQLYLEMMEGKNTSNAIIR